MMTRQKVGNKKDSSAKVWRKLPATQSTVQNEMRFSYGHSQKPQKPDVSFLFYEINQQNLSNVKKEENLLNL